MVIGIELFDADYHKKSRPSEEQTGIACREYVEGDPVSTLIVLAARRS